MNITHEDEANMLEAQLMAEISSGFGFHYNSEKAQAVIPNEESFIKIPMTAWIIQQACYCAMILNNNYDEAFMDSRVGWNITDDYDLGEE